MASYGSLPDQHLQVILRHTLHSATLARTPYATLSELKLEEDSENEVGDLVLKVDAKVGEE